VGIGIEWGGIVIPEFIIDIAVPFEIRVCRLGTMMSRGLSSHSERQNGSVAARLNKELSQPNSTPGRLLILNLLFMDLTGCTSMVNVLG
jgi:hypothetical protein